MSAPKVPTLKSCPFCSKCFIRLGNHLPHCHERGDQPYTQFLAKQYSGKAQKKKCPRCGISFKRLDTHLRNSASCRLSSLAGSVPRQSSLASSVPQRCKVSTQQAVPPARETIPPAQHPDSCGKCGSLECRDRLVLPTTQEEWLEANELLATKVVPVVLAATTVEMKNDYLCKLVHSTLAERFGTKKRMPCVPSKRSRPHNREVKRLRKQKIQAQRLLRQAQRERRGKEELTHLGLLCHKIVRAFNKALRRKEKLLESSQAARARKECSNSFWKFASHVLDEDDSGPPVSPAFDAASCEQHFRDVYSSQPHVYSHPDWLPPAASPHTPFDSDAIKPEEVTNAIKRSNSSSSPSPLDQIPYRIFKQCPSLLPALVNLYNLCWQTAVVPRAWKAAVITLIPKTSAADDPTRPTNFRPIALTSCVGKIFTAVMKRRLHSHMTINGFLDNTIQKAFQPKVPGCIEHYTKLAAAVTEAHKQHKSLTVCWLDLANAFGSVHHQLISFTLRHYYVSDRFIKLVDHLYTDLFASVSTKTWSTAAIPLKIGVFQGDPLSTEIFNTVMNTYVDAIRPQLTSLGYQFSNTNQTLGLLQYADDTCLVSNGPSSCKQLLRMTEEWLKWSGMRPAVKKCQYVSIQASTGRVVDPGLTLSGEKIPYVGNKPVRFLGGIVQIPANQQIARDQIQRKIRCLLSRVDATPVTRKQKLHLYRMGVCLRITWDLTISQFPLSWIEKTLDPLTTKFLKRWSGLAKPADPS